MRKNSRVINVVIHIILIIVLFSMYFGGYNKYLCGIAIALFVFRLVLVAWTKP